METPQSVLLAFEKTKIAKSDIENLNNSVESFFESNPYSIISDINVDGTEEVWRFEFSKNIPLSIIVTIGDILHKLRSSLDNMMCAIAMQHSGSHKGTYFPFGRDAAGLEGEIARKGKKLPIATIEIIRSLKPYKGGNDLLWLLHDANRNDKHPALKVFNSGTLTKMQEIKCIHGDILILGNRRGRHMVRGPSGMIQTDEFKRPVFRKRNGASYIEFSCEGSDENFEFMTTTPNAKFQAKIEPALSIAFSQINSVEGKQVVEVLHDMHSIVESSLLTFNRRFFQ